MQRKPAEKFKAATCIKTSRVRFRPGNMLLDMCKAMKYTLVKKGESDEAVVPRSGREAGWRKRWQWKPGRRQ